MYVLMMAVDLNIPAGGEVFWRLLVDRVVGLGRLAGLVGDFRNIHIIVTCSPMRKCLTQR